MIKNYFKIAFRNIRKSGIFSSINILGLSIGIASCILIFLYVANDFSYDKFNTNYDRIYRIDQQFLRNSDEAGWSLTPPGFGPALQNEYPEIKQARILPAGMMSPVVSYNNIPLASADFIFADNSMFSIFSFPFIKGDAKTALLNPASIVITESSALKIFGNENPMGKTLRINNKFDLKVTGVVKDLPANSTIQYNFVSTIDQLSKLWGNNSADPLNTNYSASNFYTFILVPENYDWQKIEARLPAFADKYCGENAHEFVKIFLQPFKDIHFNNTLRFDFPTTASINSDYILSAIAIFILLIACINFINISTAQAATRVKEIGLRKVLGANRSKIIWQFVTENIFLSLISVVLAAVFAAFILPNFNDFVGKKLSLNLLSGPELFASIFMIWILVVFITSSYPAVYMSSFQPAAILKGSLRSGKKGNVMRKSLIVLQFVISVFLITMTIAVAKQYKFMKTSELGFDKEQVLFIPSNSEISNKFDVLKNNLLQNPEVEFVGRSNWIPGDPHDIESYAWDGKTGQEADGFYSLVVDPDYISALNLKFVTGRNFSKNTPTDQSDGYIVNEATVKRMGLTASSAIGKAIYNGNFHDGKIIGVVKNFNFKSLHEQIEPVMIIWGKPHQLYKIVIKTRSTGISNTIGFIETNWKNLSPDFPYDYHFVDQDFEKLYLAEEKLSSVITLFSVLSILIASLGLLGLVSHSTRERTKEIGVRKVLGSSVGSVVFLLIKEYTVLILISYIIAFPAAFYAIDKWLQNFAYKTEIGWWIFALAGFSTFLIAIFTVSYKTLKAAAANPIESLRYE